jgi:hypothetical protein
MLGHNLAAVKHAGRTPQNDATRHQNRAAVLMFQAFTQFSQLCPPCATPFSNSSLDYRRSDARIVENGFTASSGVSKSAKVVLGSYRAPLLAAASLRVAIKIGLYPPGAAEQAYATLRSWKALPTL